MIGLMLHIYQIPGAFCMYGGCISAILIFCGLFSYRGGCRDIGCFRRCLRWTGFDSFDAFELTMVVHEAHFEHRQRPEKTSTCIRVTAGCHTVTSDKSKNNVFQQPLSLYVDQGVYEIKLELLDGNEKPLARLTFSSITDILSQGCSSEKKDYEMKVNNRGIRKPIISLSMHVNREVDEETGFLQRCDSGKDVTCHEADWIVQQQMTTVKSSADNIDVVNEHAALISACAGPLELFKDNGCMERIHIGILGPPAVKNWQLGIWKEENDAIEKKDPIRTIALLKVSTVQADPGRGQVFVLHYYDKHRQAQQLTFRRIDRSRDAWVELLQRLITRTHSEHTAAKVISDGRRSSRAPRASVHVPKDERRVPPQTPQHSDSPNNSGSGTALPGSTKSSTPASQAAPPSQEGSGAHVRGWQQIQRSVRSMTSIGRKATPR